MQKTKQKPSQTQDQDGSDLTQDSSLIPTTPNSEADELVALSDELLDEIDKVLDQSAIQTLKDRFVLEGLDDIKPYTLADAMREGSTVSDQCIGSWTDVKLGETCALSAAMLAIRARGIA